MPLVVYVFMYFDMSVLLNLRSYWAQTVSEATNEQSDMQVCLTLKLETSIMSVGVSYISSGRSQRAKRSRCVGDSVNLPLLSLNASGKLNFSLAMSTLERKGT